MQALVIVVRGLRPGFVGCYGNEWLATPALDRLAAEGVVFDQHRADRPDAAGARRAWRTGRHTFPQLDGNDCPAADPAADLIALLRGHGVGTSLVSDDNQPTAPEFADGWDHVERLSASAEGSAMEHALEAAADALDRQRAPGLVWVELAPLLPPWQLSRDFATRYCVEEADDEDDEDLEEPLEPLLDPAPGPLAEPASETFLRLQRTYAGAVAYLDAGLELLLEEQRKRGRLDELLIVVTSDHGLPLGEHGIVGLSRPWLHAELTHLPLLMRLPGGDQAGRRCAALTQSVDLMPTLLDAFGAPFPITHGHSLLPLARGNVAEVRPYACTGARVDDQLEWALHTPDWSFLLPLNPVAARPAQLYLKPDDPYEVNDLRQHHLELAEELEQTLRGFVAASREPGPLRAPALPLALA